MALNGRHQELRIVIAVNDRHVGHEATFGLLDFHERAEFGGLVQLSSTKNWQRSVSIRKLHTSVVVLVRARLDSSY